MVSFFIVSSVNDTELQVVGTPELCAGACRRILPRILLFVKCQSCQLYCR